MGYHPYLMFNGDCREAFTRYQEVFGGELRGSCHPCRLRLVLANII